LQDSDVLCFTHPEHRDCIYEEAEVCIKVGVSVKNETEKQMAKYKDEGYPKHNGLMTSCLLYRKHTDRVKKLNELWYNEVMNGTPRDQLCFDYCVWKLGFSYDVCTLNCWDNKWFKSMGHSREQNIYRAKLYVETNSDPISEETAINVFLGYPDGNFEVIFKFDERHNCIKLLRFDPADIPVIIRVDSAVLTAKDGTKHNLTATASNELKQKDGFLYFASNDPQIYYDVPVTSDYSEVSFIGTIIKDEIFEKEHLYSGFYLQSLGKPLIVNERRAFKKRLKLLQKSREKLKLKKKVIVSLTSFPPRFSTLHLCITSLLEQSYKPDKIILYLADDTPRESVSDNILSLKRYGVEIAHRPDNFKPHNKYFHALQEYPDDIIITVDDDVLYEEDLVLSLLHSYMLHPNAISANRVHKMMKGDNDEIAPYEQWRQEYQADNTPSMQLLATGVGGVLYPPRCLPIDTFNPELIKKLCLNADDIWLKFMEIKNNVPVVRVAPEGKRVAHSIIPNTQHIALCTTNTGAISENDVFIKRLEDSLSLKLSDYC